jgi:hypothetical protein
MKTIERIHGYDANGNDICVTISKGAEGIYYVEISDVNEIRDCYSFASLADASYCAYSEVYADSYAEEA